VSRLLEAGSFFASALRNGAFFGSVEPQGDCGVRMPPPFWLKFLRVWLALLALLACGIFGTVLGPGADEAHKNHLHLDVKEIRDASFCQ
jgi:hypothetical protein